MAVELAEVQQTTDILTGTLKNETLLAAMLAPLRQKEAELLTQLLGSGAVAQGAGSTALGERAIQAGQAQVIISGDNNSVQSLIHCYPQAPDPHELRRQIGHYLTWLLGWAGTLELYDLSGNVWEWCRNKFDNPDDDAVDDSGKRRVLRGGSWFSSQNRRARPAATSTIQSAVTAVAVSGWWCVVPISIGHWPLLGLRAVAEQARAAGVDRHFFVA